MSLRKRVIRLAYTKPHLRKDLLPLIRQAGVRDIDKLTKPGAYPKTLKLLSRAVEEGLSVADDLAKDLTRLRARLGQIAGREVFTDNEQQAIDWYVSMVNNNPPGFDLMVRMMRVRIHKINQLMGWR